MNSQDATIIAVFCFGYFAFFLASLYYTLSTRARVPRRSNNQRNDDLG